MRNKFSVIIVMLSLLTTPTMAIAEASQSRNPILHEAIIDDDGIQAILRWSTMPTSDDDDIDDYAYTVDGKNFASLFGDYNSSVESESQTTTVALPTRANASDSFFAIAKIKDNQVSGVSNMIKGKISERPVPIYLRLDQYNAEAIIYTITNFNSSAVSKGIIKYKINQVRLQPKSLVSVSLQENQIIITNFKQGERISFKTMKYVQNCNGFSPFLSCPYNSKVNTSLTASMAYKPTK